MMSLWILLFFLFAFVVMRFVPAVLWKFNPSDTLTHQYDALAIKKNDGLIPRQLEQFFPIPQFSYPWGGAWLIHRLGIKEPVRWGTLMNIFVSSLQFFLFYALYLDGYFNSAAFLIAVLIFAVSPNCVSPLMSVFGWHGRTIGSVAISALITFVLVFPDEPSIFMFLFFSMLFGALFLLIILFSQFAVQSLLLVLPLVLFFQFSDLRFFSVSLGLLCVILLFRERVFDIAKGHFFHVVFYQRILQHRHRSVAKNVFTLKGFIFGLFEGYSIRDFLSRALYTPMLRCVAFAPWLFVLPFLADEVLLGGEKSIFLLSLVLVSLLCIPIININGLRFLGESDRYFYFFGEFSSIVLFSKFIGALDLAEPIILSVVGVCLLIYFSFLIARMKFSPDIPLSFFRDIAERLELENCAGRVLCVPNNYNEGVALFCSCQFLGIHSNVTWNQEEWFVYDRLFPNVYPYPAFDRELFQDLGVEFVVVSRRFLSLDYLRLHGLSEISVGTQYDYSQGENVYENDHFVLYRVN